MWDWLSTPIDATRPHDVGLALSWHGRFMVLGWGVLAPVAVLIARFLKVLPGQDWPRELDSQMWWRTHWMSQILVAVLTVTAIGLVLPLASQSRTLHGWLGYGVLLLLILQVGFGALRGSKGGPTAPAADGSTHGDHFDMTRHRRAFEVVHKSVGYMALILGAITILLGLWTANAPKWMWFVLIPWWLVLVLCFVILQKRGHAIDTYQAIWGDDPTLPGNRLKPSWGMNRPNDAQGSDKDVRSNRGDRVRSH